MLLYLLRAWLAELFLRPFEHRHRRSKRACACKEYFWVVCICDLEISVLVRLDPSSHCIQRVHENACVHLRGIVGLAFFECAEHIADHIFPCSSRVVAECHKRGESLLCVAVWNGCAWRLQRRHCDHADVHTQRVVLVSIIRDELHNLLGEVAHCRQRILVVHHQRRSLERRLENRTERRCVEDRQRRRRRLIFRIWRRLHGKCDGHMSGIDRRRCVEQILCCQTHHSDRTEHKKTIEWRWGVAVRHILFAEHAEHFAVDFCELLRLVAEQLLHLCIHAPPPPETQLLLTQREEIEHRAQQLHDECCIRCDVLCRQICTERRCKATARVESDVDDVCGRRE